MPKIGMEPIRRSQVMEAVLGIIANEGMDGVTLDKAAKIAGVSKGVVTYYFSNKENLLHESCKAFLESYSIGIRDLLDLGMDGKSVLRTVASAVLGLLDDMNVSRDFEANAEDERLPGYSLNTVDQQAVIMQLFSRMAPDPAFRSLIRDVYEEYLDVLTSAMENALGSKVKPPSSMNQNAKHLTLQFMAMLDGLMFYNIMEFEKDSSMEIVESFIERLPSISE